MEEHILDAPERRPVMGTPNYDKSLKYLFYVRISFLLFIFSFLLIGVDVSGTMYRLMTGILILSLAFTAFLTIIGVLFGIRGYRRQERANERQARAVVIHFFIGLLAWLLLITGGTAFIYFPI